MNDVSITNNPAQPLIMRLLSYIRLPHTDDPLFGLLFLLFLTVPLAFMPLLVEGFESTRLALTTLLYGTAVIVYAIHWGRRLTYHRTLLVLLIGFFAWHVFATLASVDILNSIFGLYGRYPNSLLFCTVWVGLVTMVYAVVHNSQDKLLTLIRLMVGSGCAVAVLGILHSFGIGYYAGAGATARPIIPGFIGNQNFSAMYIVGIVPLALPLLALSRRWISRVLYGLALFVMIWSLMVFASRGAIIALAAVLVFLAALLFVRRTAWFIRVIIVGVMICSIVLGMLFYGTTRGAGGSSSYETFQDTSAQSRLIAWSYSIDLIKQHPWLGIGPGNFFIGFKNLGDNILPAGERFDDAHNLYLHLMVTTGIPAAVIFIILLLYVMIKASSIYWHTGSLISLGLVGAVIGLAVSFALNPVSIPSWILLAFLVAGACSVESTILYQWQPRRFMRSVMIVGGVILMLYGSTFYASEFFGAYTLRAYRAKNFERAQWLGRIGTILNPLNGTALVYGLAAQIKLDEDADRLRHDIKRFAYLHPQSSGSMQTAANLSFILAQRTRDARDTATSLTYLDQALAREPNYANLLVSSGYLSYQAGATDQAERYLKQALSNQNQGEFFYAWLLLAQIYLDEGKTSQVRYALERAYYIQPDIALLKNIIQDFKKPGYKLEKLPVYFPPVDI